MSKTITALTMMALVSQVPEVSTAFAPYESALKTGASGFSLAEKYQVWAASVDKYLSLPIQGLLPLRSPSGQNWNDFDAARFIRIKDLLMHRSGLPVTGDTSDDDSSWVGVESGLANWSPIVWGLETQGSPSELSYTNENYALLRYVLNEPLRGHWLSSIEDLPRGGVAAS